MEHEPYHGVRFDIYERVHVPEQQAEIGSLDEIELIPSIDTRMEQEQTVLTGTLRLHATYFSNQDEQSHALTHAIPVEITIPMNRVQQTQNLQVEIENFDIELLSKRSLNLTGVLMLKGVHTNATQSSAIPLMRNESEETEETTQHTNQHSMQPVEPKFIEPEAPQENEGAAPDSQSAQAKEIEDQLTPESETELEAESFEELADLIEWQENEVRMEHAASDDQPQIELGNRPSTSIVTPRHLSANLPTASTIAHTQALPEPESSSSAGNHVNWQQLCKHESADEIAFRKLRMCIVQKHDSLAQLAQKHQVKVTDLQRLNHLQGDELTIGQILYLP